MKNRVLLTLLFSILLLAGCVSINQPSPMDIYMQNLVKEAQQRQGSGQVAPVQFQSEDGSLTTEVPSFNFVAKGGEYKVTFKTSDSWSAEVVPSTKANDVDWVSLSKNKGNAGQVDLVITVKENETYDSRDAVVNIKSGDYTYHIRVFQGQKDAILVAETDVKISKEAQTYTLHSQTNLESVELVIPAECDWIKKVITKGLVSKKFELSISENKTINSRSAVLTLQNVKSGISQKVTITQEKGENPVNTVTKVADYLYEYTAEGYSTEAPSELQFDDGPLPIFGCSAVRNGNFFGRNFDYNINETCEFVVRTRATETRPHASIGVANTCFLNITNDMVKDGLSDKLLNYIPWMMMDGINDAGLVCNINVVNAADIKEHPHTHTNEGAPQIMVMQLVRALLDNCGSVAEAKTYIKAHDIREIPTTWDGHIMVADPNETVIVEFTGEEGNEVKFVEQTQMIMTNFYNHLFKEADFLRDRSINTFPKHSCGMERYFILSDNYATGNSMEGMWELLKEVRYTQSYDTSIESFWCSEYYDTAKIPTFDEHPMSYWTKEKVLAEEKPKKEVEAYKKYAATGEYNEEDGLWHTTHNSTYDIANKTLWVTIREKYEKHYEFTLNVDSWGSGSISNFNVRNDDPSKWE